MKKILFITLITPLTTHTMHHSTEGEIQPLLSTVQASSMERFPKLPDEAQDTEEPAPWYRLNARDPMNTCCGFSINQESNTCCNCCCIDPARQACCFCVPLDPKERAICCGVVSCLLATYGTSIGCLLTHLMC